MIRKKDKFFSFVIIEKVEKIENLDVILERSLNLIGGIEKFIKRGDLVFIKPNLTAGAPSSTGGTTEVKLVESLVKLVQSCKPKRVIVGEGAGTQIDTEVAFARLGYFQMAERTKIKLLDCDRDEYIKAPVDDPLYKKELRIARILLDCDVFISIPVLKSHISTGISVVLKNSFGLIPDVDKIQIHRDGMLEEAIVDINSVRAPDLVVVDALVAAEGVAGGVDFSHPVRRNLIIAGEDPVAVDMTCVKLMKHNPSIRHILWADKKGIGNANPALIRVKGIPPEESAYPFLTPREQIMQEAKYLNLLDLDACSGCRGVVESELIRFSKRGLLRPINIAYGPGEISSSPGELLLIGDCTKRYQNRGRWIPGCPVKAGSLRKAMEDLNLVCFKCANEVLSAIKDFKESSLEKLRILASNREIYRGQSNQAKIEDLLVLVGDCEENYYRYHGDRLRKILKQEPDRYMEFIPGCPPDKKEIKNALHKILKRINI